MDNNDMLRGVANEAQRQTHVGAARERLTYAITAIEKVAQALDQRLQVVLVVDSGPVDPRIKGVDKAPDTVPLAEALNAEAVRVENVNIFLDRMLKRIEL